MKQFPKIILLVLLTMVIVLGTFSIGQAAYLNQIQGCLIKSATSPDPVNNNWEWGAIVTLFDISGGTKTQLEQVSLDGSLFQYCFTFNSFTPISSGARTLLVEVNYNASPGGDPDTDNIVIFDDDTSQTSSTLDLGNISANTTPNAVTLSQMEASPVASPWVLFAVLAMTLGLAGGAFTIVRRRKSA